jgi:hypothetical protein
LTAFSSFCGKSKDCGTGFANSIIVNRAGCGDSTRRLEQGENYVERDLLDYNFSGDGRNGLAVVFSHAFNAKRRLHDCNVEFVGGDYLRRLVFSRTNQPRKKSDQSFV